MLYSLVRATYSFTYDTNGYVFYIRKQIFCLPPFQKGPSLRVLVLFGFFAILGRDSAVQVVVHERVFMGPVLIDVPKYQLRILRFVVLAVHVLYDTSGPFLVDIWYCLVGQL